MSKDIFNESNEVKSQFIKWGKTGDNISGTLIAKREVKNNLPGKEGQMQTIYDFKSHGGGFHEIMEDKSIAKEETTIKAGETWSVGGKPGIDSQMRNIRTGQIVGLKFTESIPSKTKGYNPTKLIKVFTAGEMDPSVMEGVGAEADTDPLAF